jgi:predicted dehydrogenase
MKSGAPRLTKGAFDMAKVRVALVGCGGIGSGFHLPHLAKMDDVELSAFCDILPERAKAARDKFAEGAGTYTDYREMLEKEKLDAVFVCVPPGVHPEIETDVVTKGLHLFIQKPMALNIAHAEKVQAAIAKAGIVSAVGFQDRYLDVADEILRFLDGKKTGVFRASWLGGIPGVPWWRKRTTGGGQVVEQNIHLFDMARLFFGEPKRVTGIGGSGIVAARNDPKYEGYDVDDFSSVTVEFENGVVGNILTGCYLTGGETNGMDIFTDKGCAYYKLRSSVMFNTPDRRSLTVNVRNDQGYDCDRTFIEAVISGNASKIRSPYDDALKSLKLVMAAQQAVDSGEAVVL